MAKLTLSDLATLDNSAISAINANNALIETAMENTLSRDGTTPNTMSADLDMNSNTILNIDGLDMNDTRITGLVAAVSDDEPVRKAEFDDLIDDLDNIWETAAQVHTDAVQASLDLDEFTDIYLGSKAADPAVDNDGDPLQTGALYFNTSANELKIYTGATWLAYTASGAPNTADYLVKTANAGLTAERVVTDTSSITWDWGTAGQAKAVREALTGDVTASQGSNATTIPNDTVTYAKMQNVSAASKLLGRGDSGAGDPQEITVGSGLSMTGTTLAATGAGSGDVTAAANIADNRLVRGDGGAKGIQESAITVADTTGDLSRTGGIDIEGTNTNDNAAAGYIGEYSSQALAAASAVTFTNNTAKTITSITLGAGDWNVWGTAKFVCGASSCTNILASFNTVTDTLATDDGSDDSKLRQVLAVAITDNTTPSLNLPIQRYSNSGSTTIYLVGRAGWSGGDAVQGWGIIRARRVR